MIFSFTIGDPIVAENLANKETFVAEKQPFLDMLPGEYFFNYQLIFLKLVVFNSNFNILDVIRSLTYDGDHRDVPTVNEHLAAVILVHFYRRLQLLELKTY